MCDSRRPLNGADCEDVESIDPRDGTCDQCLGPMFATRPKHGVWICATCLRKNEERYAAMTEAAHE